MMARRGGGQSRGGGGECGQGENRWAARVKVPSPFSTWAGPLKVAAQWAKSPKSNRATKTEFEPNPISKL